MLALLVVLALVVPAWAVDKPPPILPAIPCALFAADDVWNADVSALPVHPESATYVASIGAETALHPDFGTLYSTWLRRGASGRERGLRAEEARRRITPIR
jgi:hypothetical protein